MIRVHVAHGSAGRRLDAGLRMARRAQKTRYWKMGAEDLVTGRSADILLSAIGVRIRYHVAARGEDPPSA